MSAHARDDRIGYESNHLNLRSQLRANSTLETIILFSLAPVGDEVFYVLSAAKFPRDAQKFAQAERTDFGDARISLKIHGLLIHEIGTQAALVGA